jgi:HD-GYP domain-containing protein (c-di-GMP phosphodiesterase class II)
VAAIAYAIGKEMGWLEGRLQGLRMAAMVHDIGKISIPTEILAKPAELSPEEWEVVKRHPESSYTILKDIPFTWPIADIVRQHHEKLEGSGYPLGLRADAILPEARVLTVADIVEAMAADRPYRAALGLEAALAEIESQAGTLLDAEVVRICAALFREKRLMIPGLKLY